jgi:hypothetical protein
MIIFSYTFGGNYLLNTKQSLFESRGALARLDRILFSGLDYLRK